ncbi:SdpI family protein [Tepidiforma sp.]|uniref:SdpI family protein n=1 Tax=Tepidiforma sp. TaxID=2682230 RepID=UPI002ADDCDF2|nr:SdpI family protein [Tepidiforma sp.]
MWVVFLLTLLGSVLATWVGWRGWQERLPRQHIAGIRTPYTLSSDERWRAVHRFGAPYLIFGGVAVAAGSLALLPFAIAGRLPGTFSAGAALAMAIVMVTAALAAWQLGVRSARASLGE